MTAAGHNSLVAMTEWARRCDQAALAWLGCLFDPFRPFQVAGERILRDVFARVGRSALTSTGFARFTALTPAHGQLVGPDSMADREKRRAHRPPTGRTTSSGVAARSPRTIGARAEPSALMANRVFGLSAVGHDDALTAALREIGAKPMKFRHLEVAGQRGGVTSFRGARAGRERQSVS
jgi:hypothetical protein